MIDYRAGVWGFHVSLGWHGSLAPRALTMAIPNAVLTFIIATLMESSIADDINKEETAKAAQLVIGAFTSVMIFILYNRSNTAYDRWWEGGTLLQKARGEWFNAYSSIMAFTSTKPEMQDQVQAYCHLVARLMSLLMCCGLQQVSPCRDKPFEIIDLDGIEPASMEFLNSAPDKVEIILQWIQRSIVLNVQTGVLPVAPPILSRAFQEVSRGIVNLQNARKIADFPYPYPLAQVSMLLQLVHWAMIPIGAALAAPKPWAVLFSFFSIFVLWCIHFNALDLEFPFGSKANDLPMDRMMQDWNKSICTLLAKKAHRPPDFAYDPAVHEDLIVVMSDASDLYAPVFPEVTKGVAVIKVTDRSSKFAKGKSRSSVVHDGPPPDNSNGSSQPHQPYRVPRRASNAHAVATPQVLEVPAKKEGPDIPEGNGFSTNGSAPLIMGLPGKHDNAHGSTPTSIPASSSGVPSSGVPSSGVPSSGAPSSAVPSSGAPSSGAPSSNRTSGAASAKPMPIDVHMIHATVGRSHPTVSRSFLPACIGSCGR